MPKPLFVFFAGRSITLFPNNLNLGEATGRHFYRKRKMFSSMCIRHILPNEIWTSPSSVHFTIFFQDLESGASTPTTLTKCKSPFFCASFNLY